MWSISLISRAAPHKNGAHNIIKINLAFIILIIMFLRQNLYDDSAGDLITYFLHCTALGLVPGMCPIHPIVFA